MLGEFLVGNTIRLTIYARRLLIRTMKLVGATDSFIRRPFIVVGGELTMRNLDLIYDPISKTYEAPFQMKANTGLFVIDDFGRQAMRPGVRPVQRREPTPPSPPCPGSCVAIRLSPTSRLPRPTSTSCAGQVL